VAGWLAATIFVVGYLPRGRGNLIYFPQFTCTGGRLIRITQGQKFMDSLFNGFAGFAGAFLNSPE
jgi:hypothetical protein